MPILVSLELRSIKSLVRASCPVRTRRARICVRIGGGNGMTRWARGERAVQFLVDRNRLERFEAKDLAALTGALIGRAALRVEATATAALVGGDVDGAYVAAYDAYRMAA